uniref:Uncharacterized protein n=1 Tax=Megaselia scalaris TaxID=36166 RepID=T1GJ50_MEGSC
MVSDDKTNYIWSQAEFTSNYARKRSWVDILERDPKTEISTKLETDSPETEKCFLCCYLMGIKKTVQQYKSLRTTNLVGFNPVEEDNINSLTNTNCRL